MVKKMSVVDVMFGIIQKIDKYNLATLSIKDFLCPNSSKDEKVINYMTKICISFSDDIFKITEELQIKPPYINNIIEIYYFSMFVICMSYYEVKSHKIFYPQIKLCRIVPKFADKVIYHIMNKYREGDWSHIWSTPLPSYSKIKEYEKYFPDKIDYMFDLLYVKYLSGGIHLNEKEYTKYEEDNERFCLRMSELYHQFYANCLDTFELFK